MRSTSMLQYYLTICHHLIIHRWRDENVQAHLKMASTSGSLSASPCRIRGLAATRENASDCIFWPNLVQRVTTRPDARVPKIGIRVDYAPAGAVIDVVTPVQIRQLP